MRLLQNKSRVLVGVFLGAMVLTSACGIREDMQNQPKYKPLRASDFYANGMSARPILEGTVARGQLKDDTYFYTGKVGNVYGNDMPFPVTQQVLERGQERFNIYCSPCHSRLGDGNGMIVQRGLRRPPTFHDKRLREAPVGHFFDVISNGFGGMGEYGTQIPVHDRWAIVAYIRALQFSQNATPGDVPAGTKIADGQPKFQQEGAPMSSTTGTHGAAFGQGGGNPTK